MVCPMSVYIWSLGALCTGDADIGELCSLSCVIRKYSMSQVIYYLTGDVTALINDFICLRYSADGMQSAV